MHYHATPYGLPGNDDFGAMSTFLLFTSLGLFPHAGTTLYFIGSPSVSSATVDLLSITGETKYLKVIAYNNTDENVYVNKLLINGVEYNDAFVEHDFLFSSKSSNEVKLEFYMTDIESSGLCIQ
jgi:putative alpha-1,2-mannosidase